MNILIPHQWLLEQLKTKASPEKIQEYLSLSGPSVERIDKRAGDSVYDIEITTNRVDAMSVRGIAREAAAILPQFDVPATLEKNQLSFAKIKPTAKKLLPLPKIKNSGKLSRRISCVILQNVKRTPTPDWMAKRLEQVEMNIHDSAIDITNYITHELGHPVHAFDYDKIMELGGEIIVTTAKKDEKFTTLDGESYLAVGGEVVFRNPAGKIIDIPSVKGTINSAIDDGTNNVLLWIESILPEKVRFTSMTHAIRTVAAQLAEKDVDPHLAEPTLVRGIQLYQELCEAEIASEIYDAFPDKIAPKPVSIDLAKIHTYLGIELPLKTVVSILEKLECQVKTVRQTLHVTPPTFRQDLTISVDIIEEIARIYGYHQLPSKLMPTRIPLAKPADTNFAVENTIKHYLADIGWQEAYTYSMVSEELAEQSGHSLKQHAKLANPLTEDKVYLRRSVLPSLQEVLANNSQVEELSVFEMANVYEPQKTSLPNESLQLAMVSTKPYRQVKGDLESLLRQFYITDLKVDEVENNDGQLKVNKTTIGTVSVQGQQTLIELSVNDLLPHCKTHPTYQPLPKTASVIEQLTFKLPPKTAVGPILREIEQLDEQIKSVALTDTYQANYTLTIEYWDADNNLSNEDVRPIRKKIVSTVEKQYRAQLIGKVQ